MTADVNNNFIKKMQEKYISDATLIEGSTGIETYSVMLKYLYPLMLSISELNQRLEILEENNVKK